MQRPAIIGGPFSLDGVPGYWKVACPGCGVGGIIDDEQYHGQTSIGCPFCPYHETHDLSAPAPEAA